ncbi:uncharacterized protein TNCV_126201 [Trichonephila clavipes]|nr:uncharacterized protein TNCV_126201 [Trichonephila clavipes]
MQSAVIAAFFHCCSSKHQPKHGHCPVGDESWCKFQRAKASNIVYQDKSLGLPQNIVNTIKPVYMDLCHQHSVVEAFAFPSYPRHARLERDLVIRLAKEVFDKLNWEVERGKFYDPVRSLLKSKNQKINRLQLADKLPWAIFFESVDILS